MKNISVSEDQIKMLLIVVLVGVILYMLTQSSGEYMFISKYQTTLLHCR